MRRINLEAASGRSRPGNLCSLGAVSPGSLSQTQPTSTDSRHSFGLVKFLACDRHLWGRVPPTAHRLNRTLLEWPQSTIAGRTHPPSRRFAGSGLGPVALCKVLDLVRPPSFCHWTWEDNLTRDFSIVVARFGVGTKNRFVPGVEIYLCPNALVKTHLSQPPNHRDPHTI